MAIPSNLLLYCALACGIFLLLSNWALDFYERHLIARGHWSNPQSSEDEDNSILTKIWNFIIQWILYAGLPIGLYSWLHLMLPLEGPRAGIAIAIWTVAIGTIPFAIVISERHNIPFIAIVFQMFSHVIKLIGTLAIIGILFSL